MKLITPKYFSNFKCKGGSCTDNCCIGWEINIDEQTREKYRGVTGELGERMKQNIDDGGGSHFKLLGERCPFLNRENLCDIIIGFGEGYLCDICREHPRYYTILGDIAFSGVGLSCEAAAELILSENGTHEYTECERQDIELEECDDELLMIILRYKQTIVDILCDNALDFSKKLEMICRKTESAQCEIDGVSRLDFCKSEDVIESIEALYSTLEYLDPLFLPKVISPFSQKDKKPFLNEKYLKNLMLYFIDRYVPKAAEDGDLIGKMTVAYLSAGVVGSLLPECAMLDEAIEISKEYSKEIEYNEENISKIEDAAWSGIWQGAVSYLIDLTKK